MACPFSGLSRLNSDGSNDDDQQHKQTPTKHVKRNEDRQSKPARQSSVQIASLLLHGEDVDDQEDNQTLNLKHLRSAVLMLTNPAVSHIKHNFHEIHYFIQEKITILTLSGPTYLYFSMFFKKNLIIFVNNNIQYVNLLVK